MSPPSDAELARVAAQLGDALRARDWRLATAESSTGGLIGHAITMTPGATDYYVGGVICYSNLAKELALGVPHELIESHGAVSEEVAAALAVGAAHRFEADLGISVTGIAGPDGGSERKPIGTHFLGVVRRGHPARVAHRLFEHDREGNQASAAMAALELALDEVAAAA
jgi:PncC family amidohydrolase